MRHDDYRKAAGLAILLLFMAALTAAEPASRLLGSWGVDIRKLNESNPEMKNMSSEDRAEIEKELSQLAFVFDEKTVTMTDRNGEETSSPYEVVSSNDRLVILKIAQEDGGVERLRIRFTDDKRMELIREGDEGSLYLIKK
jgi:hypothetical protein